MLLLIDGMLLINRWNGGINRWIDRMLLLIDGMIECYY